MTQQLLNAMVLGSVFLLFSLGLSLAWGTLDVLNLAHGALFILGAFVAHQVSVTGLSGAVLTVVVAMIVCGVVAAVLEVVALRRIRGRTANKRHVEFGVLVASLGAGTIVDHVIDLKTGNQIFAQTVVTPKMHELGGVRFSNIDVVVVLLSLAIALALHLGITRWRHGRSIRAVAVDRVTAGLMGINVNRVAVGTLAVSGALAGLAGVLLAFNSSGMLVSTGQSYMISAFAILVVGGVGSVVGAVVISYALAIAQTAVVAYGPSEYQTGVAFALILVFLVLRPSGLFARELGARV